MSVSICVWIGASGLCTASDAFFMKKEKIREEDRNANAVVLQCLFFCDMLFASLNSFFPLFFKQLPQT